MKQEQIRKALNVPEGHRIAQHIYNKFRDYEDSIEVLVKHDGKFFERSVQGIDIFHVEDDEFIKRFEK